MKKSHPENKLTKLRALISESDLITVQATNSEDMIQQQHKSISGFRKNLSKECETRNQLKDPSDYLIMSDNEMFLKTDLSEEPIDLNPWCKEWKSSCLDEELLSSNLDVQREFCIDHFTDLLQSSHDPRSPTELSTNQHITTVSDHLCVPKDNILADFDQHIINVYDSQTNLSDTIMNNKIDLMDVSEPMKVIQTNEFNESSIWEVVLQDSEKKDDYKLDNLSFYLNKNSKDIESTKQTMIYSPSNSNLFLETCPTTDPMETYQLIENSNDLKNNDTEKIFSEQSVDFAFTSDLLFENEKLNVSNDVQNQSNIYVIDNLNEINNKPVLNLKLIPDESDCSINTPDVIDNAISLEGDFNLLSYIDSDASVTSVLSDVSKFIPVDTNEINEKHKNPITVTLTTPKSKCKQEKRGRPPKLTKSSIKVEINPGESEDDFKYRELRNKNNEASRRSRMLRKEREMHILTTLHNLEKHNLELKNNVSYLENECYKYRKKLVDAMSK